MSAYKDLPAWTIPMLDEIKEMYEEQPLIELLSEANLAEREFRRRKPDSFRILMMQTLYAQIEKKLK